MSYRATDDSSDLTLAERLSEAKKIIVDMKLINYTDTMSPKESEFVEQMFDEIGRDGPLAISIKQLWWLRDLRDKYLL